MPSRILREGILTSERVNSLSERAELFYRRLMSVVDDWGRFSANPTLLRASCYPLKLDCMKEDSIKKHLAEAASAGLIVLYMVSGKEYLEMQDFRQQTRSKESKHPPPDERLPSTCYADAKQCLADDKQMHSNDNHLQAFVHLDEVEVEVEVGDVIGDGDDKRARGKPRSSPDFDAARHLKYLGVESDIANDWLRHRKTKKALPTKTAIDGIASEAVKAGVTLADALRECCQRGWVGFKADWMESKKSNGRARESPEERRQRENERGAELLGINFPKPEKTIECEVVRG